MKYRRKQKKEMMIDSRIMYSWAKGLFSVKKEIQAKSLFRKEKRKLQKEEVKKKSN